MIRAGMVFFMSAKGWSAQKVAERSRVSINTIHNIVSGKTRNPNIDTCVMIADGFEVSLDTLINAGKNMAPAEMQQVADQILQSSPASVPAPPPEEKPVSPAVAPQPPIVPTAAPGLCHHHDAMVNLYERDLATKNRWIICLFGITVVLLVIIAAMVIFGVPCRH